jgi:hypothetical protein
LVIELDLHWQDELLTLVRIKFRRSHIVAMSPISSSKSANGLRSGCDHSFFLFFAGKYKLKIHIMTSTSKEWLRLNAFKNSPGQLQQAHWYLWQGGQWRKFRKWVKDETKEIVWSMDGIASRSFSWASK